MNKNLVKNLAARHAIEETYHDEQFRKGSFKAGHSSSGEMNYYKFFYELIGNVHGLTVLDVGCGNGWLSIKLAKSGASVYGIDISGELIEAAKRNAINTKTDLAIEFKRIPIEDTEFEDNLFDIIIGSAILHHTDIKVSLQKIFNSLKTGGRALFIEPLNENPALKLWRMLTPKRRSPTERALRKDDLDYITRLSTKPK